MRVTFEIYPSPRLDPAAIPEAWQLTIAARSSALTPTLELHRELGLRATPHISAGLIRSEAHLREVVDLVGDSVFLIGGDAAPLGPYRRSAELIPAFRGGRDIGVAGYPESHPSYPDAAFGDRILLEKQGLGATHVVTQLSFDPEVIRAWVQRVRDRGVTLPVYCGVSAPLSAIKLLRIARGIGVGDSLRLLNKLSRRTVMRIAAHYDPRPLMEALADHVQGFHIYTFNAVDSTRRWVDRDSWLAELADASVPQPGAA